MISNIWYLGQTLQIKMLSKQEQHRGLVQFLASPRIV